MPIKTFTKNYLYKHILNLWILNRAKRDPKTGDKAVVAILNGGGSRAGKTFDIVHVLLTIMRNFADPKSKNARPLYIAVYRDTLVNARKRTFEDFTKCLRIIGLVEGKDFTTTNSATVKIEIMGHTIEFLGIPPANQQPVGCDIAFVNELIENNNEASFIGIKRRTELLFLADWNPKESVHWAYNIERFNTFYTLTTYLDNKHLPEGLKSEAEAQCPWMFEDSELYLETYTDYGEKKEYKLPADFDLAKWKRGEYAFDGFLRRRWLKEEAPENCREEDLWKYRRINHDNIKTANRADYLTYGMGIPSGQEGAIFKDVTWVKEMPKELDNQHFGLDYGFSNDPSSLVSCGNIGMDMYVQKLCYQKTGTSDLLFDLIEKPILNEEKRRYIEANNEEWYKKLQELRFLLTKSYAIQYENEDLRNNAIDTAKENLFNHIDSGLPIAPIYIVTDTADLYKGRGSESEQNFTIDLNLIAQRKGYNWSFIKVGSKPIVPGIALMKKFNLHFIEDNDVRTEQQNYVYLKDDAGNPTNIPDKDSKYNHIFDAARYCIWKMFKYLFPV